MDLGPNVINNGIYFFYNGSKLNKSQEQETIGEVFNDSTNIIVIDTNNLLAAKQNY